jgi:hypothetical protein
MSGDSIPVPWRFNGRIIPFFEPKQCKITAEMAVFDCKTTLKKKTRSGFAIEH